MAGEHAGRSLIEILWEQLDVQYAKLMELREKGHTYKKEDIVQLLTPPGRGIALAPKDADRIMAHLELKGKVAGLAYAIAKITNPYGDIKTQMELIREEARERWEAEYEEEEEDGD